MNTIIRKYSDQYDKIKTLVSKLVIENTNDSHLFQSTSEYLL